MAIIPPLNQIAFSVVDLRRTERWFREGFGLLPAGGSRLMMRGPLPSRIQGLPKAASTCWWLVARNPWFQLELFQFESPIARLMPHDFRPCDVGYTRIGLWVADFDATLVRLADLGSRPLAEPIGSAGSRRACVRSPDGVYVEIFEDDPLPQHHVQGRTDCPVAVRSVTLSVPDLERSAAFFGGAIGLAEAKTPLHTPEDEALWGLAGARTVSKVFEAGDVLVEIVQYRDPIGKRWPDGYRISDQGILNIAFGARSKRELDAVYGRTLAAGARPNFRPITIPGAGVVYVNDVQGFSVELLWMNPGRADRAWGFEPLPIAKRPDPDNQRISAHIRLGASVDQMWAVLNDQEAMSKWIGFDPVEVTRAGFTDRNGIGSERSMRGPLGRVVEQIVDLEPKRSIRYRVIEGSPFELHQGEISLRPMGNKTEVTWTIRFRSRIPFMGRLWRIVMQGLLGRMLKNGLRRYVERRVPRVSATASSLSG